MTKKGISKETTKAPRMKVIIIFLPVAGIYQNHRFACNLLSWKNYKSGWAHFPFPLRIAIYSASFTYSPESPVKVDSTLNFMDNSTDPDGSIANWTWDFDDGIVAYGNQTNHSYNKTGSYNVTLTVTDNDRDTDSYTVTIKVEKEEEEDIPAFEFAFLIIAIVSIMLLKRKNKRNR